MNRNEAIDMLETIRDIYPKFNVTERKAKILLPQLAPMDYSLVMEKLSAYVAVNPFPPTIAAIAAYPPEVNEYLDRISKWREEAAQVPDGVKQAFHEQMVKLLKEKSNDSNSKYRSEERRVGKEWRRS